MSKDYKGPAKRASGSKSGAGSEPLIIVGVVVAYLVTIGLDQTVGAARNASPAAPTPASAG